MANQERNKEGIMLLPWLEYLNKNVMHFGQWLIEDYKSDKIARQETVEACQ